MSEKPHKRPSSHERPEVIEKRDLEVLNPEPKKAPPAKDLPTTPAPEQSKDS
jgi:hypothetical protein